MDSYDLQHGRDKLNARSRFVLPDHMVDLNPVLGDLDGDGLEYRRQLRRTRCRRQGVKNIMFEFESKICFIKNIVRCEVERSRSSYGIFDQERRKDSSPPFSVRGALSF